MSISCKKATELVSKKEEGKISLRERFQLMQHMSACYLCKFFAIQNKQILKSIKKYPQSEIEFKLTHDHKSKMINNILES